MGSNDGIENAKGLVVVLRSFYSMGMGSHRLDTIAAYVRHGHNVRVDCRLCKRVSIIPAAWLRDQRSFHPDAGGESREAIKVREVRKT